MAELTIRTIKVEEAPLLVVGGAPVDHVRVTYMVGDHGPFTFTSKRSEFSRARFAEEAAKLAAEIAGLPGV